MHTRPTTPPEVYLPRPRIAHAPLLLLLSPVGPWSGRLGVTRITSASVAAAAGAVTVLSLPHLLREATSTADPEFASFATLGARPGLLLVSNEPMPDFSFARLSDREVDCASPADASLLRIACARQGMAAQELPRFRLPGTTAAPFAVLEPRDAFARIDLQAGHLVARLGDATGALLVSTLAAREDWLQGDEAVAFGAAYMQAREVAALAPAREVAERLAPLFPDATPSSLTRVVALYQGIGCWRGDGALPAAQLDADVETIDRALSDVLPRAP